MATKPITTPGRIVTPNGRELTKEDKAAMTRGLEAHGYVTLLLYAEVYDPEAMKYVRIKGRRVKVKTFSLKDAERVLADIEGVL